MKKIFAVILALIGIATFSIGVIFQTTDHLSVTVAGGSESPDGPVSVMLAGELGHTPFDPFIILGIVLLLISIMLWIKRKK